jgi:ABC-2 type transport system ATP-binding protein
MDTKAKKYSKGMKQRLLICMALMSDPEILFLDEPTSGLDVQSSIIIKQLIKEYHQLGLTIILTTHDMNVANELCNRIAIINKGKLICVDDPQKLRELKQDHLALDIHLLGEVSIENLESMSNINSIKKTGKDCYHLIVKEIMGAIIELLNYFNENNIKLLKLNTYEPKLEEVFIELIKGE